MSGRILRMVVTTKNGKVDKFVNCVFIVQDGVLCITERNITYCYPLNNVILYEFEKV